MKQQHREYLKLNKNILLGFAASIIISATAAQLLSGQENYLNATFTLVVDYAVYFSTFGGLYYFDNRKKYLLPTGTVDRITLRKDLIKIISSLGVGEVVYTAVRWLLQYYLLTETYQPYLASLVSQSLSTIVYMVVVNFGVKVTGLYKNDA